jgi:hypothetical protein
MSLFLLLTPAVAGGNTAAVSPATFNCVLALGVVSLAIAILALLLVTPAFGASCPNEEVRAEQGAGRLPDCRAFELVTPEIKADNGNFFGNAYGFPDGNHVYYGMYLPLPGVGSGGKTNALSTRTASGWVNTSLAPLAAGPGSPISVLPNSPNAGPYASNVAFTGDFSQAFVASGFDSDPLDQDYVLPLPGTEEQVFRGTLDAYRLDLSSGAWSLAALPDAGPLTASFNAPGASRGTFVAGVSEDGSHVFFQSSDQLPVAPVPWQPQPSETHPFDMLYDRTGGHTYAVGVLPDGTFSQTCPTTLGEGVADTWFQVGFVYGAISPDGTNVVFMATNGHQTGTHSDAPCGPTEGVYLRENDATSNATTVKLAGVKYVARSSDGSKVFTTGEGRRGVFEYDIATGATSTITTEGRFVASSADGSRVYYLNSGGPNPGLYLWDKGTSVLIPHAGEGYAGSAEGYAGGAIATPDGSRLLFLDRVSLTGYNNFGPKCVEAETLPGFCAEAYVYDATTGAVTCVSCNPAGAPPLGNAGLMQGSYDQLIPGDSEGLISPDGSRVFFETPDALVPQDTNGLSDVYEWESGRVYLISSGQGTAGSSLSGASSNGNDVFVTTTDRLAPQDIESATQIYDARAGGGFPYRPFVPGCDSGQCQGPQTPAPSFGAPASATFVGLGNPVPAVSAPVVKAKPKTKAKKCKKGLVKKKNKCVRKKPSKTAKRASVDREAKSHA